MHFVYIDDSGDGTIACFSALIIPADSWRESLAHLMSFRKSINQSDGIYIKSEMHATDWNAGKGRIAPTPIVKERRAELFKAFLTQVASIQGAQLINSAVPKSETNRSFQFLLQRIQNNMKKRSSKCVVFCDEGKSYDDIKRRIGVHNYIPSKIGDWGDGNSSKNIPADRVLEDIVYRKSERSLFIQAADACAYSLLRREKPIPSKTALGLHEAFYLLEPILVKRAFASDPYGIIR